MADGSGGPKVGPSLHYLLARGLIKPDAVPRRGRPRKAPTTASLVYFVRAHVVGYIKIGKADCVHTRFRTLKSQSPDTLILMGAIQTRDATRLERSLHKHFAQHRVHGEWFRPDPELMTYIKENAKPAPPMRDWRETRYGPTKKPRAA